MKRLSITFAIILAFSLGACTEEAVSPGTMDTVEEHTSLDPVELLTEESTEDVTQSLDPAGTDTTEENIPEPETTEPETAPCTTSAPAITDPPETSGPTNPPDTQSDIQKPTDPPATQKPTESFTQSDSKNTQIHTHNYAETVVDPTCTENGYTLYSCTCGKSYTDNQTHKRGHLYGDWVYIQNASLTSTGYREAVCTRCGNVLGDTIPALNPAYATKYEGIDSRIVIDVNGDGAVDYRYGKVAVVDTRTWGGAPILVITEEGGFDITYYKQDGSCVNYSLRPVEGYINQFVIWNDGAYATQLWGDFND